ncbi:MAG: rubrerythrin [Nanoarchaeota archaeon]
MTTEENLKAAFAGESQARNKYAFYAKVARKEGYHYIADLFEETAMNEMQHAKDEFKLLGGIGDTVANLQEAIDGEAYETKSMYPQFAKEAEEEGNEDAAKLFRQIAKVEEQHEARYTALLNLVKSGNVFKRDTPIRWKCSKCGFIHEGKEPPMKCPSCKHPKEYYEPECMCFSPGCAQCCQDGSSGDSQEES